MGWGGSGSGGCEAVWETWVVVRGARVCIPVYYSHHRIVNQRLKITGHWVFGPSGCCLVFFFIFFFHK